MKRENGSGTIKYLGKGHRRPYGAVITVGWELKDGKAVQKRKALGYFKTKAEARHCLEQYYLNPYDTIASFTKVYEMWSEPHYQTITYKSVKRYEKAYERSEMLYSMPMGGIRLKELEAQIDAHSDTTQINKLSMKQLWSMMFNWAIAHEYATTNYASMLHIQEGEKKVNRTVFTPEEIQKLWDDNTPISNLILVGIYSGWRPSELINLEIKDGIMLGGSKTELGRNRIVPIHSKITHIIAQIPSFRTYAEYRNAFAQKCLKLRISHLPHDTRHTFATLCDEFDVKPEVRATLMGHTTSQTTERVYTHRTIATLSREIEKIKI